MNLDLVKYSAEERCFIYHWLRQIYLSEPSMEFIEGLIQMAEEFESIDDNSIERDLYRYLRNISTEELKELKVELKAEYARLFLGPHKLLAPPYESVYRSPRKRLMGEETIQVRNIYKEAGMEVKDYGITPDDHVGFELEFMYYLNYLVVESIEEYKGVNHIVNLLQLQKKFIDEHLIMWIPEFCTDIIKNSRLTFFKEIAKFTRNFVERESITVDKTINLLSS